MRVLIAEDDFLSQEMLRCFLEDDGYEVDIASDGQSAWEQFLKDPPRVVITDWNMPGLTGVELCQRIRTQYEGKYVYVILVTSNSERDHFVAGLEAGADEFITKPFDPTELRVRLEAGSRILRLEDRLEEQLAQLEVSRKELEETGERLHRELDAGADLQKSLLPDSQPESKAVRCGWAFQPCDQLGGDGLNFYDLADDRIGFSVTDVCGHGVKSALLAVTVQNVLNPRSRQTPLKWADSAMSETYRVVPPPEVLARLNAQFPMDMSVGQYFTMLYGVLETETGRLSYSSAGHPPPMVLPESGAPIQLPGCGFPIGLSDIPDFQHEEVRLNKGDRLLMFSDGLIEAKQGGDGECCGVDRVLQWLEDARMIDTDHLGKHMLDCVIDWTDNNPDDDVSILVIEYMGVPEEDGVDGPVPKVAGASTSA